MSISMRERGLSGSLIFVTCNNDPASGNTN